MSTNATRTLQTQRMPTSDLRKDPGNVRKHDRRNLDAIKASLREFGQQKPIVVDANGMVLAGNGTLDAAIELGWTHIDVVRSPLAGAAARAYAIADNRTTDLSEFDDKMLAEALASIGDVDAALLECAGFDDADVAKLLGAQERDRDPDDVPDLPERPTTREGDVWNLGSHVVVCGDATVADDVRLATGQSRPQLVVTDPPYGVAYQTALSTSEAAARNRRKDGKEVMNDDLGWTGTRDLVAAAFTAASLKPGVSFYVFCPPGDLQAAFWLGLRDAGLNARHQIVWVKDRFVMGRCDYHYRHEVCLYGWADGARHFFVADRTQDSVWECDRPRASKQHPTMKPVSLFERCMINSSKRGWTVYDPFLGSGTSVLAAEMNDRRCIGLEKSPAYCDVIVQRWEELTGKKAERKPA